MSRDEYLNLLRQRLAEEEIPGTEQMVSFYAEMIDDRIEDGMTEAQFKETMLGLNAGFESLNDEAKKLEAQISLNLRGLFADE